MLQGKAHSNAAVLKCLLGQFNNVSDPCQKEGSRAVRMALWEYRPKAAITGAPPPPPPGPGGARLNLSHRYGNRMWDQPIPSRVAGIGSCPSQNGGHSSQESDLGLVQPLLMVRGRTGLISWEFCHCREVQASKAANLLTCTVNRLEVTSASAYAIHRSLRCLGLGPAWQSD